MKESFRNRLRSEKLLIGTLLTLPSPEVAEILSHAGFDWLFIDLEHSPLSMRDAQVLLQIASPACSCIMRVPLNDEIWIKKALDSGADGVMVPQVNSAEATQQAVHFSKYPPQGGRSVGVARAHAYGARLQEYIDQANSATSLIIQVEHIQAVRNIESILATEGLDGVLIGPYDLSASMGLTGQVEHPEVQAAIGRVLQACREKDMPLGIFAASVERARKYAALGFRFIAIGGDVMLLLGAANDLVREMKTPV